MHGRVFSTGSMLLVAVQAAKGIDGLPRDGGKSGALVSIVFAAVTLEAFLNESIEMACDYSQTPNEPKTTASYAHLMAEFQRSRIEARYQMAHWVLTGAGYDKGSTLYQDFSLLFELRNNLVHFKPDAPLQIDRAAAPCQFSTVYDREKFWLSFRTRPFRFGRQSVC